MVILLIGLLLCSRVGLHAAAQQADKSADIPAIRGVVREAVTQAPISDVEVSLSSQETAKVAGAYSFQYGKSAAKTRTDMSGAFSFEPEKPGSYSVSVSKEGYFPESSAAHLELKPGGPPPQLTLVMGRMALIEGQVVDADTDRPVPHLNVLLRAAAPAWGVRRLGGQSSAPTDAEGRFRIGARPHTYFLAIRPRVWDKPRLLATFSQEDRKAVAEDYEETYWPGAADIDTAVPIAMASGGVFSTGVVRVRKMRYYSVRVLLPAGSCAPGEAIQFSIPNNRFGKAGQLLGRAPCGKEFLLAGFPPGSYLLEVRPALESRRPHEEMRRAEVSFEIADRNLDIPVTLERGIDVEGKIVVAEGAAKPAFTGIGIFLEPVIADATVDEKLFRADDQGKLRIVNVRPKEQWFDVTGVPEGYCVREVRYNGTTIRGRLVPFQNGGVFRTLEIVLDDKPAGVTGTVMAGDRPASRAEVLLAPWPVDSPNAVWPPQQAAADDNGKFQFSGLAPGDYLLVALPPELKGKWREPGVLQPLLSRATKVTLQERGFQTVTLGASGLR